MRYNITPRDELSRAERKYRAARWITFALVLLFFYVIMRAGIFGSWQPVLLIPLCVCVSMYEGELSSCIFALFCGYMNDIAFGFVFGFSAVWLMAVCVASSLLVRNLIRVNLVNFMIEAAAAIFIEFSMQYLFYILIWNVPKGDVILKVSVIPTALATLILSPAVYFLVKLIETRIRADDMRITEYDDTAGREQGEEE